MDKLKFNDKKEWKKFGIGLAVILCIFASILWFKDKPVYLYFCSASILFLISAFLFPIILKPVFIVFSYFGFGMNWIITRLILITVYYCLFAPINLVSRLFGKEFLRTKLNKKAESYWEDVSEERNEKINYERQF